ncbi:hypothetical protein NHQ30_009998 [Ciborinia camelliae]|nr:hypothetical protein NHQ30_009998 [Ciborinia camelliae]
MPLSTPISERRTSRSHCFTDSQDVAEQGLSTQLSTYPSARLSSGQDPISRSSNPPYEPVLIISETLRQSNQPLWWQKFRRRMDSIKKSFPITAASLWWQTFTSRLNSIQTPSPATVTSRSDLYKPGYKMLQYPSYENMTCGWPQISGFLESCDSFGIYRRFGTCHSRLLVSYMNEITALEKRLRELDDCDYQNEATRHRLKCSPRAEDLEPEKRDILLRLEQKLLAYGKS